MPGRGNPFQTRSCLGSCTARPQRGDSSCLPDFSSPRAGKRVGRCDPRTEHGDCVAGPGGAGRPVPAWALPPAWLRQGECEGGGRGEAQPRALQAAEGGDVRTHDAHVFKPRANGAQVSGPPDAYMSSRSTDRAAVPPTGATGLNTCQHCFIPQAHPLHGLGQQTGTA